MRGDDFFVEVDDSWGPNSEPWRTRLELNRELLHSLSLAPVAGYIAVEVVQILVDLVSEELAAAPHLPRHTMRTHHNTPTRSASVAITP